MFIFLIIFEFCPYSGRKVNSLLGHIAILTMVTDKNSESYMNFSIIKDGPYEFVLDLVDDSVIVIAVVEGGMIQKHGGIKAGDRLISVNEYSFAGQSLELVVDHLESLMNNQTTESLKFQIQRGANIGSGCQGFKQILEANEEDDEVTSL